MDDSDRVLLWIHQSNLLWSRLQTISAIQVGVFTGWYFLRGSELWLANCLLGFAIALLILFIFVMRRDIQYMDGFGATIIDALPSKPVLRGRVSAYILLSVLGLANLLLLILSPQGPSKPETLKSPKENLPQSIAPPQPLPPNPIP